MSNVEDINAHLEALAGMTIEDTIKHLCKEVGLTPSEEDFEKIIKVAMYVVPITMTAVKLQMLQEMEEDEHIRTRH